MSEFDTPYYEGDGGGLNKSVSTGNIDNATQTAPPSNDTNTVSEDIAVVHEALEQLAQEAHQLIIVFKTHIVYENKCSGVSIHGAKPGKPPAHDISSSETESQRQLASATLSSQWTIISALAALLASTIATVNTVRFDLTTHISPIDRILTQILTKNVLYKDHEYHFPFYVLRLMGSIKNAVKEYAQVTQHPETAYSIEHSVRIAPSVATMPSIAAHKRKQQQNQNQNQSPSMSTSSSHHLTQNTATTSSGIGKSGLHTSSSSLALVDAILKQSPSTSSLTTSTRQNITGNRIGNSTDSIKINVRSAAKHFEKIEADITTSTQKMKKRPEKSVSTMSTGSITDTPETTVSTTTTTTTTTTTSIPSPADHIPLAHLLSPQQKEINNELTILRSKPTVLHRRVSTKNVMASPHIGRQKSGVTDMSTVMETHMNQPNLINQTDRVDNTGVVTTMVSESVLTRDTSRDCDTGRVGVPVNALVSPPSQHGDMDESGVSGGGVSIESLKDPVTHDTGPANTVPPSHDTEGTHTVSSIHHTEGTTKEEPGHLTEPASKEELSHLPETTHTVSPSHVTEPANKEELNHLTETTHTVSPIHHSESTTKEELSHLTEPTNTSHHKPTDKIKDESIQDMHKISSSSSPRQSKVIVLQSRNNSTHSIPRSNSSLFIKKRSMDELSQAPVFAPRPITSNKLVEMTPQQSNVAVDTARNHNHSGTVIVNTSTTPYHNKPIAGIIGQQSIDKTKSPTSAKTITRDMADGDVVDTPVMESVLTAYPSMPSEMVYRGGDVDGVVSESSTTHAVNFHPDTDKPDQEPVTQNQQENGDDDGVLRPRTPPPSSSSASRKKKARQSRFLDPDFDVTKVDLASDESKIELEMLEKELHSMLYGGDGVVAKSSDRGGNVDVVSLDVVKVDDVVVPVSLQLGDVEKTIVSQLQLESTPATETETETETKAQLEQPPQSVQPDQQQVDATAQTGLLLPSAIHSRQPSADVYNQDAVRPSINKHTKPTRRPSEQWKDTPMQDPTQSSHTETPTRITSTHITSVSNPTSSKQLMQLKNASAQIAKQRQSMRQSMLMGDVKTMETLAAMISNQLGGSIAENPSSFTDTVDVTGTVDVVDVDVDGKQSLDVSKSGDGRFGGSLPMLNISMDAVGDGNGASGDVGTGANTPPKRRPRADTDQGASPRNRSASGGTRKFVSSGNSPTGQTTLPMPPPPPPPPSSGKPNIALAKPLLAAPGSPNPSSPRSVIPIFMRKASHDFTSITRQPLSSDTSDNTPRKQKGDIAAALQRSKTLKNPTHDDTDTVLKPSSSLKPSVQSNTKPQGHAAQGSQSMQDTFGSDTNVNVNPLSTSYRIQSCADTHVDGLGGQITTQQQQKDTVASVASSNMNYTSTPFPQIPEITPLKSSNESINFGSPLLRKLDEVMKSNTKSKLSTSHDMVSDLNDGDGVDREKVPVKVDTWVESKRRVSLPPPVPSKDSDEAESRGNDAVAGASVHVAGHAQANVTADVSEPMQARRGSSKSILNNHDDDGKFMTVKNTAEFAAFKKVNAGLAQTTMPTNSTVATDAKQIASRSVDNEPPKTQVANQQAKSTKSSQEVLPVTSSEVILAQVAAMRERRGTARYPTNLPMFDTPSDAFRLVLIPLNAMLGPAIVELTPSIRFGRNNTTNHPCFRTFTTLVVSRNHMDIFERDGKVYIKDIGSNSGTFRNNTRLSPPSATSADIELQTGDYVQLGKDYVGDGVEPDEDGWVQQRRRCVQFQVILVLPGMKPKEAVECQDTPIEEPVTKTTGRPNRQAPTESSSGAQTAGIADPRNVDGVGAAAANSRMQAGVSSAQTGAASSGTARSNSIADVPPSPPPHNRKTSAKPEQKFKTDPSLAETSAQIAATVNALDQLRNNLDRELAQGSQTSLSNGPPVKPTQKSQTTSLDATATITLSTTPVSGPTQQKASMQLPVAQNSTNADRPSMRLDQPSQANAQAPASQMAIKQSNTATTPSTSLARSQTVVPTRARMMAPPKAPKPSATDTVIAAPSEQEPSSTANEVTKPQVAITNRLVRERRDNFVISTSISGTKIKKFQITTTQGHVVFDVNLKRWEERSRILITDMRSSNGQDASIFEIIPVDKSGRVVNTTRGSSKSPEKIIDMNFMVASVESGGNSIGTLDFASEIKLSITSATDTASASANAIPMAITGDFKSGRFILVKKFPNSREQKLFGECKGRHQSRSNFRETQWLSNVEIEEAESTPLVMSAVILASMIVA